jgi:hypothetical protein
MTPDLIQALNPVLLAIIAAITAWQGRKIKELSVKFDRLSGLFRSAVRHIRDWQRWDRAGRVGTPPSVPEDLIDEV